MVFPIPKRNFFPTGIYIGHGVSNVSIVGVSIRNAISMRS